MIEHISAHWQEASGEWREFEQPPAFIYQSVQNVIALFEGRNIPVVLNIDGGYICTKNVFAEVRRRHGKKVLTFASLKATSKPFYEFLQLKHSIKF